MNLVDTHAHLNELEDIEKSILRSKREGLAGIVAVGMDLPSNRAILWLSKRYPGYVFAALGAHPWSLTEGSIEENLAFIEAHIDQCIAIGEIGLDYKVKVKKEFQKDIFIKALEIAKRNRKPVSVHARFSHIRTHQMVSDMGIQKAVFHWYSGPMDILERILEDGYMVSATPALRYSQSHRAAMERAPMDRILIESDAPVVYQGKESRPYDIDIPLRELAQIKGIDKADVAEITAANARSFFGVNFYK